MPIYDYVCSNCTKLTEVIHGIDAPGPKFCPACGAEGTMRKTFATPAVHFKGSGWAKKDRASSSRPKASSDSGKSDGEGSASSSKDGAASAADGKASSGAEGSGGESKSAGTSSASSAGEG